MKLTQLFKSTKQSLSPQEQMWKDAFEKQIAELVPGEKFTLITTRAANGVVAYSIETESKRAMIAWSEIQEAFKAEGYV